MTDDSTPKPQPTQPLIACDHKASNERRGTTLLGTTYHPVMKCHSCGRVYLIGGPLTVSREQLRARVQGLAKLMSTPRADEGPLPSALTHTTGAGDD